MLRPRAAEAGRTQLAQDPRVEIVKGDLGHAETLAQAHGRVRAPPTYLVHSMEASGTGYASRDRELAEAFAALPPRREVGRIIYLGGLGELGDGLSQHLRSRREVEARLDAAGVRSRRCAPRWSSAPAPRRSRSSAIWWSGCR